MSIVIDEVVGSVEPLPEASASDGLAESGSPATEPDPARIRGELERLERRAARLRAD